jgi:formylglycine-generating enzyme required for sulfatase activity
MPSTARQSLTITDDASEQPALAVRRRAPTEEATAEQGSRRRVTGPVRLGLVAAAIALVAAVVALALGLRSGRSSPHGEDFTNSIGMEFKLIPRGTFPMGTPEAEGEMQHEVTIDKAFYLGKYEVKQKDWVALMKDNPSYFSRGGEGKEKVKDVRDEELNHFPVESVSYFDAQKFIDSLNEKEKDRLGGWRYSLPTEAQWEYACQGGATSYQRYHFGDSISRDDANFNDAVGRTQKAGAYPANKFGLHDMHGNVWEWCLEWYDKDYKGADPDFKGSYRVFRGGSWGSTGGLCRAANRAHYAPARRGNDLGFRVALVAVR